MPCLGVDTGASFRWMELFQRADRVVMGRDWGGGNRGICRLGVIAAYLLRQLPEHANLGKYFKDG